MDCVISNVIYRFDIRLSFLFFYLRKEMYLIVYFLVPVNGKRKTEMVSKIKEIIKKIWEKCIA